MKKIFENEELLRESAREDDLVGYDAHAEVFADEMYRRLKSGSICLLVADFGKGKKNFLNLVKSNDEQGEWILFDAWKYPDRMKLWEGFILDVAHQTDDVDVKSIISEIENGRNKTAIKVFNALGVLSGTSLVEKLTAFLKTSPATRTFQLQEILINLLEDIEAEHLNIVIEDIDRSGDNGRFFLETLKKFLESTDLEKNIRVFVPISVRSFTQNRESYEKCSDIIDKQVQDFIPNMKSFVDRLFCDNAFESEQNKNNFIDFLTQIFVIDPDFTIRKLKHGLRNALSKYRSLEAR